MSGLGTLLSGLASANAIFSKSHKSNLTSINPSQPDWVLMGQNKSVVLAPESTEGPFCECTNFLT